MNRFSSLLGGLALGAGLMFFLDPDHGGRRRAQVRDRAVKLRKRSTRSLGKMARDLQHRTRGLMAESASRLRPVSPDDVTLVERVRSKLGRAVSHPHAVHVSAEDGKITLHGPILREEASRLLMLLSTVRGVRMVNNQLEMHDAPDVSALQGGRLRTGIRPGWAQAEWSPALCAFGLLAGGSLLVTAGVRRGWSGVPLGLAGTAVLTRSVFLNPSLRRRQAVPRPAGMPRAWPW